MTTEPATFDVVVAGSGDDGRADRGGPRTERGGHREGRGVRRVDGAVGGRDLGLEMINGRMSGVHATRGGEPLLIRTRRGVLIATGGFERNEEMRRRYQREPVGIQWTTGAPGGRVRWS